MATSTISIEVDADAAKAYTAASEEQRRKLRLLLNLGLREIASNPPKSLSQVMNEMGLEAKARGLTPEILEKMLHDE